MEITKENHTIVRVTEISTKINVELNMINQQVNSLLHDPNAKHFAGEEIVNAMQALRTALDNAPSINEMIKKA